MTTRGRLCFYAPHLYPVVTQGRIPFAGGAEVQQWLMALGLHAEGFDVSIVTCDYGQPACEVVSGIRLLRAFPPFAGLPVVRFFHPRLTLATRAMLDARADLYFVQGGGQPAGLAYDVARLRGARYVFMTAHDTDCLRALPWIPRARDRWWTRRALRGADRVIAQTDWQRSTLEREFGLGSVVVRNPVDVPEQEVDAGQDGAVVWLATYKESKRPEWFLELARRLPHRRFVMAGVIPVPPLGTEHWEAAVAAGRERANLEVQGFVAREQLSAWLGAASLFVHTSPAEGFANTVLEAWAHGLPTVTGTDPDGIAVRERIGDCVDSIDGLVAAVERWMSDPEARRAAGVRARAYCVRDHGPARIRRGLGDILSGVLAGGKA